MKDENLYSFMNNFVNAAFDLSLGKMKKKNTKFKIIQKSIKSNLKVSHARKILTSESLLLVKKS